MDSAKKTSFREAEAIFRAGLTAADPGELVKKELRLAGRDLVVGEELYSLDRVQSIYLLGAGKAAGRMARGAEAVLGPRITGGMIILPHGTPPDHRGAEFRFGAHPIPDQSGVQATEDLLEIVGRAGEDDLVIMLLSGGGSALLTAPPVGISLEGLRIISRVLLKCGASIGELNTIRKHLSRIKGGGLARFLYPTQVVTLILSDVVGDDPAVIASGPTAPDPTTFRNCLDILDRYGIRDLVPSRIRERLVRGRGGMIPETPDGSDPIFRNVRNIVIGNNRIALMGAAEKSRELGYNPVILSDRVTGDTRRSAQSHCALAAAIISPPGEKRKPLCLLSGGETTVVVKGSGQGGRNTEFVLACSREIAGRKGITILSGGTDGIDGETPSAGAFCDGTTLARGEELSLDAEDFLDRNDSYTYFQALGDIFITGPTGTNVMDIRIILLD
jgi:glycerate 2-kinase